MLPSRVEHEMRQTMEQFQRALERTFGSSSGTMESRSGEWDQGTFLPGLETWWTKDELVLRLVIPGVSEKNLKINVQGNQLVLDGERKSPEEFGTVGYSHLMYGKFHRVIELPNGLNLENIRCTLHDGLLDVRVPVAAEMKPREIPITAGTGERAISAKS